jgi:metal-sulfur cluster biosynthetic enzyme
MTNMNNNNDIHNTDKKNIVIDCLKTVYDPEFPMVDLYTLGLIYDVNIDENQKIINLLMTYTTPSCPM